MKRVLFICSQNRLRSPTAEQLYASTVTLKVRSAGVYSGAKTLLTVELIEWADVIFVMEKMHKEKLLKLFRYAAKKKQLVCLDIQDKYEYMSPKLIRILTDKLSPYLGPPKK